MIYHDRVTATDRSGRSPLRVAVVNDFELVLAGVARMLAPHAQRVEVVELNANRPVDTTVDVALYDTFAQAEAHEDNVQGVIDNPRSGRVAVYTWNFSTPLIEEALTRGAAGYLSKGLDGHALADAVVRIADGEVVVSEQPVPARRPASHGDWPGRLHGLTEREAEILALLTEGSSNAEIAQALFIGVNSVKTHVRTLYKKIDVHRRTQAVAWGERNGFTYDRRRLETWRLDAAVERSAERVEGAAGSR